MDAVGTTRFTRFLVIGHYAGGRGKAVIGKAFLALPIPYFANYKAFRATLASECFFNSVFRRIIRKII